MTIHLVRLSPSASCDQPGRLVWKRDWRFLRPPRRPYSVLLPVGFAVPFLLPGPRCALTAPFHPYLGTRGGLLSVALSLGSPPPEVIRHRASKEPGLSSLPADTLATGRAAIRPADRANKGLWALGVKPAIRSRRPSP